MVQHHMAAFQVGQLPRTRRGKHRAEGKKTRPMSRGAEQPRNPPLVVVGRILWPREAVSAGMALCRWVRVVVGTRLSGSA